MPVGTSATVKGVTQSTLEEIGVQILLANTYHLYLRPGHELIREMGGLHSFMSWPHPILTDSGGFQVFSLSELRQVTDQGVTFRSHLDGSRHSFSPEKALEVEIALGADIIMVLDECIEAPADLETTRAAAARTLDWAAARAAILKSTAPRRSKCSSGSCRAARMQRCGGKTPTRWWSWISRLCAGRAGGRRAPREHLRHDRGGHRAPSGGSSALPDGSGHARADRRLRDARDRHDGLRAAHPQRAPGCLFTSQGKLLIKNARYAKDPRPLDPACGCAVCARYSRAYLRHLYASNESLAAILNSHHNIYFYLDIMAQIRKAIRFGTLEKFAQDLQARLANKLSSTGV